VRSISLEMRKKVSKGYITDKGVEEDIVNPFVKNKRKVGIGR